MYCSLMEERPQLHYHQRNRPGINKTLIEKTVDLNDRDFLVRNLFKSAIEPTATFTYLLRFLSFLNAILRPFSDYYHV